MFPVTTSQSAVASSCHMTAPFIAAPSLRDRIDEIAREILMIEGNYPKLMALTEAPETYRDGCVFYSAWLYTLYLDLRGFLQDPEERKEGVSLLFGGDGYLVPAPMPDAAESAEIQALIARTDEMPGLFPEEVYKEMSTSPEEFVAGFRQEAIKAQLAFKRLVDLHYSICEHNICVKAFKDSVSSIIIEAFEGKLNQVFSELNQLNKALEHLPAEVDGPENKYQQAMEDNAIKVVHVAYCILEEIAKSLPPMNIADMAAPSRITHKSKIDQRCAIFYQNRARIIELASMLQRTISERTSFRHLVGFAGGSSALAGSGSVEDTRTAKRKVASLLDIPGE